MPKPALAVALFILLASAGCGEVSLDTCTGIKCVARTVTAIRGARWNEYCATQPGCISATEGMVVTLGPQSAGVYAKYGSKGLACSEVIFTAQGGGQTTRRFILVEQPGREKFKIMEEVNVASCLKLEG